MNISVVASGDYFSTYGGGQVYVRNVAKGIVEKGSKVQVISIIINGDEDYCDKTFDGDIAVLRIGIKESIISSDEPLEIQRVLVSIVKDHLLAICPDVVHANGWKATTAIACKELGIPCVITAHHGGIVCPNGMLMTRNERICSISVSVKNCLECALHFVPAGDLWSPVIRCLPDEVMNKIGKTLKRIQNIPFVSPAFMIYLAINQKLQLIEVLRRYPAIFVAPSKAIQSVLIKNGIHSESVKVIPHGIKPLSTIPLTPMGQTRPLRLGYVGRIAYVKGLHVLFDAIHTLADASYELHVFGEAATKAEKRYEQKLKKISRGLPVFWHGKIAYENLQQAYERFEVMILPSICLEVFGLTVLEALSAGRPVIATRCGGPEDIIEDGVNGLLVPPNDSNALKNAIYNLISDRTLLHALEAHTGLVNTLEEHVDALLDLYRSLCSSSKDKM
jgi:glycosyltransferase involved in cell wall biosynthesis